MMEDTEKYDTMEITHNHEHCMHKTRTSSAQFGSDER